jgi:hypothetical protein
MPELTPEMVRAMDQCSVATLISLRRLYPVEADWLFAALVARNFIDMVQDNPAMLDSIIDTFNSAVDAPVQLVRRSQ